MDFLNDNSKLNFAKENPKERRTQGSATYETMFKIFINDIGCMILL